MKKENNKKLKDYMALALKMAILGLETGEVPVGAVLLWENQVIAQNHNQKEALLDPTAHAEILVICEAAKKLKTWRLEKAKLFVTVEPCIMCMGAIIQARIPFLVFGANEFKFGGVESTADLRNHPMLPRDMEIYGGILEKECREILQIFFKDFR